MKSRGRLTVLALVLLGLLGLPPMANAATPPTLVEPGAGFAFTARTQIPTFKVNAPTGKAGVFFQIFVSRSNALNPPGDFFEGMIDDDGAYPMYPGETSAGTYAATPDSRSQFLRTPGTWYWQAGYLDSGTGTWVASGVRQLIVKPLPGPNPVDPPDGAKVAYGGEIKLTVQDQPLQPFVNVGLGDRYVSISRDPTRDAEGDFISSDEFKLKLLPDIQSGDPNRYSAYFASPFSKFPGKYYWIGDRLDVTAGDADNHVSGTEMRSFTVKPESTGGGGGRAPNTILTKTPPRKSSKRKARFEFRSKPRGAKFQCQYAGGWRSCRSPLIFRRIPPGKYVFRVRAVKNGRVDRTPASCRFTITKKNERPSAGSTVLRRVANRLLATNG